MLGTNPNSEGLTQVEVGELIIRRDTATPGIVELWTLDADGEPAQASVSIEGLIPDFDPQDLDIATLDNIGDVDYKDGNPDGLSPGNAGWVLTWDGQKWVVRPQAALEFDGGVIPSLNYIGDVNYSHYSDGFPRPQDPGKFVPSQHDVLWWEYNYNTSKYEWAPIPFRLEYLQDVQLGGPGLPGTEENWLVLNSTNYKALTFGNGQRGIWDKGSGLKIGSKNSSLENYNGRWDWYLDKEVVIKYRSAATGSATGQISSGLRYDATSFPSEPPTEYHLATIKHVRDDFTTHSIGELIDVNTAGVLQGQVLVWNSLTGFWEPGTGPAPDFSAGSISELADVELENPQDKQQLRFRLSDRKWINDNSRLTDLEWDYCDSYDEDKYPDSYCKPCDAENAGRIITFNNIPKICLFKRRKTSESYNSVWGYIRLLIDGYNSFGTAENRPATGGQARTDPIATVGYTGLLGSLENVSTADAFPNATIIYNWATSSFVMGYPALDLSTDSIGELGDVCAINAGIGYGLIWNGDCWEASSLEQKIRLDDLQDVQFGELGITNDKLVAAFTLVDGEIKSDLRAEQDLSASLAVSVPKSDAQLGTTTKRPGGGTGGPPGGPYVNSSLQFDVSSNWTLPQKLDNYVRWNHDGSWQTVDGDGCIEIWFYPYTLLDNRTILRKEARQAQAGGYILRINENGSLYFSVTGAEGKSGFSITSPTNFVSMNNWHHVACTREGNINRLYLDGDLVGSKESVASWTGDGMFTLGRNDLDDNNTLTHDFFRGFMCDLRVTKGRPKYNGTTYTLPVSIEKELIDTTPQAGDFLSYNGTVWTNVAGVTADITSNSITELADVDTTSRNPDQGDALVWTGEQWEPGIPGIGATWALDDMSDVSTNYQAGLPWVRLDQAEALIFSNTFIEERDNSYISHVQGEATRLQFVDGSFTCDPFDPTSDGPYSSSHYTYFEARRFGQNSIRGIETILKNKYSNCTFPTKSFHTAALKYDAVPGTGDGDGGAGITTPEFVPSVGNNVALINHYLNSGNFGALSDVTLAGAINGMALIYRDGQWVPSSDIAADISENSIDDLGDVDVAGATEGQVLTFDEACACWVPDKKAADLDQFPEFGNIQLSYTQPMLLDYLKNARASNGNNPGQNANPNSGLQGVNQDNLFDLKPTGYRGIRFYSGDSNKGSAHAGISNVINNDGTTSTVLYNNGRGEAVSLEINADYFRFASRYTTDVEGIYLGPGYKVIYEDVRSWENYSSGDLIPKSALIGELNYREENLDLSIYSVDDLGDVDSTGKGQGWALTWDIESGKWLATQGVAANLLLSSIGELKDVEKQSNSDTETNDGWLTFDVGGIETSRPWEVGGGMTLPNQVKDARFGWSEVIDGVPLIINNQVPDLNVWQRWESDRITIKANQGQIYTTHPALGDLTIPSWYQVKQQIVKQQTDFTALFLLEGNQLKESIYDWPLDWQVTTAPNPAYFSKFEGQWSYSFSRNVQDKVFWSAANGCPQEWPVQKVYSFEFWFYTDETAVNTTGGHELLMGPVLGADNTNTNLAKGIQIAIRGNNRNRVWATSRRAYASQAGPIDGGQYAEGDILLNQWNHVYLAQEGEGRFALFLNGVLAGRWTDSTAPIMNGGISIGGRNIGSISENSYFTGFIDDFRITDGWVPYPVEEETVPVPVEPLTGAAWTYKFGTLDQLTDVRGTDDAINGQALIYNGIDDVWEPGDAPGYDISANSINEFVDVDTDNSTPDQDDVLRWNADTDVWERSKVDGLGGIRPLNARTASPGAVPQAGTIYAGELFLNMADRKLWALDDAGQPFVFANGDLEDKINEIDRVVGGDF